MLNRGAGRYELFRSYPVPGMSGLPGFKRNRDDLQAAEGFYEVCPRQMNPESRYHLAFDVGYPNAFDSRSRSGGDPGGEIMVHGNAVSAGCWPITDPKIRELYVLMQASLERNRSASGGRYCVPTHVFPFRMTDRNLGAWDPGALSDLSAALQGNSGVHLSVGDFWRQLRPGYDQFDATHLPPRMTVTGSGAATRYVMSGSQPLPVTRACRPVR